MEVTTENGESALPYPFHCRKGDVQVAYSSLWKALDGLALFKESETTTRFLARISNLEGENSFFMYLIFIWLKLLLMYIEMNYTVLTF